MPNYKEIIRMKSLGMSERAISRTVGSSRNTVKIVCAAYLNSGLSTDNFIDKSDSQILELLKLGIREKSSNDPMYVMPDFEKLGKELKKPGVTMKLLWEEYCYDCRKSNQIPYKLTQFKHHFRKHIQTSEFTDIIQHRPGDAIEVDWAGKQPYWSDPYSGEVIKGYLFVGVLSYSGYGYAEVCADMKEKSWINAHCHMFEYFGGTTRFIIPDNLKTGITRHGDDDIVINRYYQEMAQHYNIGIIPARVRRPKDKPLAENLVNKLTTEITGRLRNYTFFSIDEYNEKLKEILKQFNERPFQKKKGSRSQMFFDDEAEYLSPLPVYPYEFAQWKKAKVQSNSHISFGKKYYSVPHEYIGCEVDLRITESRIVVFYNHIQLCSHAIMKGHDGMYSTVSEHMPKGSNAEQPWNKERFIKWANRIGPFTVQVITNLFAQYSYQQQGYNGAKSILLLADKYTEERLEKACEIALNHISHPKYKNIKAILENNQDKYSENHVSRRSVIQLDKSPYLRGASYYEGGNEDD